MENRRQFLKVGGAAVLPVFAGCSSPSEETSEREVESEVDVSGSPESGWTEFGYNTQRTNSPIQEQTPREWVQTKWRTEAEGNAVGLREPFTPIPLGDRLLVEAEGGNYISSLDLQTGENHWQRRIPGVRNGSIIGDVGFFTGNNSLEAISLTDGDLHWKVTTENHEPGTRAVVANEMVYSSLNGSTLEARAIETGELHWTYGDEWTPGAPAIYKDTVYLINMNAGTVHAVPIDPDFEDDSEVPTAEASWTKSIDGWPEEYLHQHSVVIDGSNNLLFVVASRQETGRLLALDASSGETVWSHDIAEGIITGRPSIAEGTAYIGTQNGVVALDYTNSDQTQQWTHETETRVSDAPTVSEQLVYISLAHGEARALDRETGARQWSGYPPQVEAPATPVSPIPNENRLYLSAENGTIAYERQESVGAAKTGQWPTRKGGYKRKGNSPTSVALSEPPSVEWIDRVGSRPTVSPVLADGIVVFGTNEVNAVDAASGELIWQAQPTSRGTPRGLAINDGRVFILAEWSAMAENVDENQFVVQAHDLFTGKRLWQTEISPEASGGDGPILLNGTVYVSTNRNGIIAIDESTGEIQYRERQPATHAVALNNDRLITTILPDGTIRAWSLKGTRDIWRTTVPKDPNNVVGGISPIVVDETVYISEISGPLYALHVHHGEIRWQQDPPLAQDKFLREGVADTERLYFISSGEQILSFNRHTGEVEWRADLSESSGGLVRFDDLLVFTEGQALTGLSAHDGTKQWSIDLVELPEDRHVTGAGTRIAIGEDGLYISSEYYNGHVS